MNHIANNRILNAMLLSPDLTISAVSNRQSELILLLNTINSRLSNAPDGTLRIAKRGNAHQYYHRTDSTDRTGTYIKKKSNLNLAKSLAQKEYDLKVKHEIQHELHAIETFLKNYSPEQIEHLYNSLNEIRQELITPVYTPAEDTLNLWNNVQYNSLDIPDDTPDFYSDNGEQVRSKSELIIANKLKQHNIPYKYEYPLVLSTGVTVHPDFTCLNINTRQEFIWEHFGIMGDSEYMNKTLKKINDYAKSGYVLGRNFIVTFESSSISLNSNTVDININEYLLLGPDGRERRQGGAGDRHAQDRQCSRECRAGRTADLFRRRCRRGRRTDRRCGGRYAYGGDALRDSARGRHLHTTGRRFAAPRISLQSGRRRAHPRGGTA